MPCAEPRLGSSTPHYYCCVNSGGHLVRLPYMAWKATLEVRSPAPAACLVSLMIAPGLEIVCGS